MSLIGSDLVGEIHEYHMYPLVIVSDRYGGCYSHGKFTVWNCYPENIPEEIFSDDNTCSYFWSSEIKDLNIKFGVGDTIQEAIDDLYFKESNPWINIKDDVWWSLESLMNLKDDYVDPHFSRHSFTLDDSQRAIEEYKKKKREHNERMEKEE